MDKRVLLTHGELLYILVFINTSENVFNGEINMSKVRVKFYASKTKSYNNAYWLEDYNEDNSSLKELFHSNQHEDSIALDDEEGDDLLEEKSKAFADANPFHLILFGPEENFDTNGHVYKVYQCS